METRRAYDTDWTAAEWRILAPRVPAPAPNGHPAVYRRRELGNALLYFTRAGGAWRLLPHAFPPWPTVDHDFHDGADDGTWEAIHATVRGQLRCQAGRATQPSAAVLDSQSVTMTDQAGPRGYDGAKKITGRKRHLLVDTMGLLLLGVVTAASVSERDGAKQVVTRAKPKLRRLHLVRADAGYKSADLAAGVAERCCWVLAIVAHLVGVQECVLLPWRGVVERPFGWLNR